MIKFFQFFLCFSLFFLSCKTPEQIIFSSNRDGNSNLFIMNGNGKNINALTDNPLEEWAPTIISKDEITFLRQDGEKINRVLLNLKTKEESPLAHPAECILDDKNIIYAKNSGKQLFQCNGDIFVAEKDGANPLNLTKNLGGKSFKASWYPDESKVTFSNNSEGNSEIYAVDVNGEGLENLTQSESNEEAGEISPDGNYLLFSSNREGNNNQDLYTLNLSSRETINITNTPNWELIGRWSNDGKSIYFGSNKDGNWELYKYYLKSKKTKRLTYSDAFDGDPRVRHSDQ